MNRTTTPSKTQLRPRLFSVEQLRSNSLLSYPTAGLSLGSGILLDRSFTALISSGKLNSSLPRIRLPGDTVLTGLKASARHEL